MKISNRRIVCSAFAVLAVLWSVLGLADVALDSGGVSGQWYDPDRDGEGFFVEIANVAGEQVFVVAWFTYGAGDDAGTQAWITGAANIPDGATTIEVPVVITSGATFGPTFEPDDVVRTPWGTLTFNFPTCDTGTVDYASSFAEFDMGSIDLIPLTKLEGVECTDDSELALTPGTWRGESTDFVVCFQVSQDATQLEPSGSSCEGGASLVLQVLGTEQNGAGCSINVQTTDAIEILSLDIFTSLGVFNFSEREPSPSLAFVQINGMFTSPNALSGTGMRNDSGSICEGDFTASPDPAG